jgi:hypothetical protein
LWLGHATTRVPKSGKTVEFAAKLWLSVDRTIDLGPARGQHDSAQAARADLRSERSRP